MTGDGSNSARLMRGHPPHTDGQRVSGYFFDELKAYIGFDDGVERLLHECKPLVEPHYEDIVVSFYDALWNNPRARAVFSGPDQIARLRATLHEWLESAFTGPWDERYFERRSRIGQVHVDVGLLPHFMGGAMNIIRRQIVRVLYQAEASSEHLEAVERLLDLELTIMLQSYWDHMMALKLKVPLALASGLAHEIRNPLNAIGLNLTLLERRLRAGGEDASPILEAVRAEVRRISSLTNEMMDFARPIDIRPQWHRIDQLLSELQTVHGATFDASEITFSTAIEGDPYIWCDVDRLRQALINLLTNAVEAIDSRGEITVSVTNAGTNTLLTVTDDGEGMEPTVSYQIFDLFFTRKATGTGLGLPIVKNIIDAHGGSIDVSSKRTQGTTFQIRLPRPTRTDDPRGRP